MCKFFSANSNGKNKVIFFKLEDVVSEMAKGNPNEYDFNSHTSIAHFHGISAREEDKWNKWEYDCEKKNLRADSMVTTDDRKSVQKQIEKYLDKKDISYLRNMYYCNSGDCNFGNWNSGDRNSGNSNSGDRNSGDCNSGYCNSGNCNSGDCNSGDCNSGDCNFGNRNSGDRNSGSWNSGDWNSGNRNSGNCNSGNWNSGYWNSGNCNSGNWNSGDCNSGSLIGHFCTKKRYFLFDKECTEEEAKKVSTLGLSNHFSLCKWVKEEKMSEEEKEKYSFYKVTGGYLKVVPYKKAWANVSKDVIERIKWLKNFDASKFEKITGLKV